jgi:hypothetical protein
MIKKLYTPKMNIKEVLTKTITILIDSLFLDSEDERIKELRDLIMEMDKWGKSEKK